MDYVHQLAEIGKKRLRIWMNLK